MYMQEPFDVYLLDTSNYQFVSVIPPCVPNYNTKCLGSVKDKPDDESRFELYLLDNGKVALKANNGLYLSRIAYSNNAFDNLNHIQPTKGDIDSPSEFEIDYAPEGGPFENIGTIALKANNGRYVAPSGDTDTIKPLATEPHKFLLLPARSGTARRQFIPRRYRWW